jgi:hypothetical protein
MAKGVWTGSYCLNTEGFPKLLYTTMQRFGIRDHPEYEGREYEEQAPSGVKLPFMLEK